MHVERNHPAWRSVAAALVVAVAAACAVMATSAHGAEPEADCQTDVWSVSTRGLPGICRLPSAVDFGVERYDAAAGRWERSDLASLLDGSSRPLLVFIHGNRYPHAAARQQAVTLARRAVACDPAAGAFRTVVFSWPSEQQGLLLKDGRAKYRRSFAEGHYLAWLLGQIGPERPVAIVGYSFGAIITLEAFEDLVAAERAGRPDIQPWIARPAPVNVVFIAAAVRCDALAPRGPYREALECIDRLTLLVNSSDDALRFFPLLDHRVGAEALGYIGMPAAWMPAHVGFSQYDAATAVGKTHGFPYYLGSTALTRRICAGASAGLTAAE